MQAPVEFYHNVKSAYIFEIYEELYCLVNFNVSDLLLYTGFFSKLDLGKRLTKVEILYDNSKLIIYTKLKHTILKILSCVIFPITIAYYIIHKKMIYDEYLGITIRDKKIG